MKDPAAAILKRGQPMRLPVRPGDVIVAALGEVQLILPAAWLAERAVCTRIGLREGETHVAADAGMIIVDSSGDAEILHFRAGSDLEAALRGLSSAIRSMVVRACVAARQIARGTKAGKAL